MFVYENLPDTIPVEYLEYYLQTAGHCCITKVKGELYALLGSPGGEYDAYYQPTKYVVANPYLDVSDTFTIGEDCVLAKSDYMGLGILPLLTRYAGLMAENVLTIRASDINMRNMFLLSAPDDDTLASAKEFVSRLEDGKLSVIADTPFFDGIRSQSTSTGNGDYMIQFIELQQYLKGSLYNELGLNANFNMKREALSGDELAMNDDALMPLIDQMLEARRKFVGEINDLYGTNISVDFGSTWHSNTIEKAIVADSEYGATSTASEELAGNEASLPDSDASQLADAENQDSIIQTSDDDSQLDTLNPDSEPPVDPGTDDNGDVASDKENDSQLDTSQEQEGTDKEEVDNSESTHMSEKKVTADEDKIVENKPESGDEAETSDDKQEPGDQDQGARGLDTETSDKEKEEISDRVEDDASGDSHLATKTTSDDDPDSEPSKKKEEKEKKDEN